MPTISYILNIQKMKNTSLILIFVLLTVGVSCQSNSSTSQSQEAVEETSGPAILSEKLSPSDFLAKLNEKGRAQVIDVRTPGEVENGYIKEAINLDIQSDAFQQGLANLDPNQPIFVYCAKGGRSGRAAKMLKDMGFVEIYDLEGGYTEWAKQGLEADQ